MGHQQCVILYLGKATAKLYVEAHRVVRRTESKKKFKKMVWKALGREITALLAWVYLTSVLCVQSETFPQLNDNTSDLRIFSTGTPYSQHFKLQFKENLR